MENPEARIQELLKKYQQGICSPEEIALLKYLYNFSAKSAPKETDSADFDVIRDEIWSRLPASKKQAKSIKFFRLKRLSAAAAVLVMFGTGIFYLSQKQGPKQSPVVYANDIAPGKQAATLMLGNGRKIILSSAVNGELAKEAGIIISKTADGQIVYNISNQGSTQENIMHTLSTAAGETYKVVLPDGSAVWLNAASSLTYSASKDNLGNRKVQLEGEAYFEIFKDQAHPFIVESRGQQVEVLGTHFNVNAYANEPVIKTTLFEGLVKIIPGSLKGKDFKGALTPVFLKPNQQAVFNGESIKINETDIIDNLGWLKGKFIFRDEALPDIMKRVSLWYDIDVQYVNDVSDLTYWGSISRATNISHILNYFSRTGNVEFQIQGRKVIVKRK